jgi:hypothetical protein
MREQKKRKGYKTPPFDRKEVLKSLKIEVEYAKEKEDPFLSVLTRCYFRPNYLYILKSSLECQTDKDFEHILLKDMIGQGIGGANCFFYKTRDLPKGEYIFMLDDDNFVAYADFIKDIKEIAAKESPDIIYFKKRQIIEYPTFKSWGKGPVMDHIDTSCFCVKREIFEKYIIEFCQPKKGDYFFLQAAHFNAKKVYWFDKLTNLAYRISSGKKQSEQ